MSLSDLAIRQAKEGPKLRKLSDGGGLQLWIKPNGSKLWCLAYRGTDGKQKKYSIGPYPTVTLQEARNKREEAKRLLLAGLDPVTHNRTEKANKAIAEANNAANTFASIAADLLDKKRREGKASNTIGKREWLYGLAGDAFGKRPIADITSPEVLKALRVVEGKGHLETARRMRSAIGEVFRYAIATQRASHDPTFALRGALAEPKVEHRAAILEPQAIGALLRAIDGFNGQPTTIAALKLMAILFPRPGELRQAEWKEFDLERAVWTIPAARMKMRREHRVPLPRQAIAVLESLLPLSGNQTLVLPGTVSVKRPMSENTINGALRRMGFKKEEMTAHGFRAMATTFLNESGKFSRDAIDRALSHQEQNAVRRAYVRSDHWEERVRMAAWWADKLDTLRDGAKILAFLDTGKR
ncbi:MAG: tyrosine-type recombinase/integrase [Methylobacterium sp.]|nr:tyrosine-type recombinase/integrase [Methylobacterium sp.]MCA3650529.1 tyrosine-type recombinase/integrase [Methylobacterium sp.]MCA4921791.1 tyrosine-type recombinase/integrase [Methylobacterium sp.]